MAEESTADRSDLLVPILVAGYGRSGTTALMALLGTDERVAFDRSYPFEHRYLTYVAKLSMLASGAGNSPHLDSVQLNEFEDGRFGAMPWDTAPAQDGTRALGPSRQEWLASLWQAFSRSVRRRHPGVTHYAEKAPAWLAAVVREVMPCRVIHLVRDPRDVFLSARGFSRVQPVVGFGMEPDTSDMAQARHTVHGLLAFAENEMADRGRNDRCLVRYEDWARRPETVVARLNAFLGLELAAGDPVDRYFEKHATSADLAASVGRWLHEPLPAALRAHFERHLAQTILDYGYELSPGVCPADTIVPGPEMRCSSDGSLMPTPDGARVELSGDDFWIEFRIEPTVADAVAELWMCARGTTGDHCSVYWHGSGEPYDERRSVHVPFRPGSHWEIVRFRLDRHPLWRGTVDHLRLDLFNGALTSEATGEVRWIRLVER